MLKGIDPLINPDLLRVLAQMGHGDEIVIADANFPSASVAKSTIAGAPLRMDCDSRRAVSAVLSLMPLDDFEPHPVLTMQVVGTPDAVPEVVSATLPLFGQTAHKALERFEFYQRAKAAFAIVRTAESRPYGNFVLRKGVISARQ